MTRKPACAKPSKIHTLNYYKYPHTYKTATQPCRDGYRTITSQWAFNRTVG